MPHTTETSAGDTDTSTTEKSPKRSRGTGFPRMSLPDAVAAIKSIAAYGFQHEEETVAGYLGHTTANSGPFRTKVAALRDYGLLSADGYSITELGQQLSHPDPAAEGEEREAMKKAFRKSDTLAKVYDSLRPGVGLTAEGIGNTAVRNFGVSPGSKTDFEGSFVQSAVAAGLMTRTDDGELRVATQDGGEESEKERPDDEIVDDAVDARKPRRLQGVPVVHHTWKVASGEILFEIVLSGTMRASAYGQIQKIIEQGDQLAELIGPEDAEG
jgi:hypothetical protein